MRSKLPLLFNYFRLSRLSIRDTKRNQINQVEPRHPDPLEPFALGMKRSRNRHSPIHRAPFLPSPTPWSCPSICPCVRGWILVVAAVTCCFVLSVLDDDLPASGRFCGSPQDCGRDREDGGQDARRSGGAPRTLGKGVPAAAVAEWF